VWEPTHHTRYKARVTGSAKQRIALTTGGGDAPGLNAVIRAVAVSSHWRGWEVLGIRYGYRGLIEPDPDGIVPLDRNAVRGITHLGGSILGTANRGDPFNYPLKSGDRVVSSDVSDRVIERAKALGISAFVVVGGDGSLRLASRLLAKGLPRVVAVPKTIDNDLAGTDQTFGFDTAVDTATDALDKLHTTAQAHERVMVVEVMGRYAGWIALYAGIAGGADVILIPEIPFAIERVCEKIRRREARGRHFSIVVVAEGARPHGGEMVMKQTADTFREPVLGGIAERVAEWIADGTGKETRALVLGHLQRGGSPVMTDRLLALRMGCAATRFLATTTESGMVALRCGELELVPLSEATRAIRTVPPDSNVLQTGRDLGLCFGDEPEGFFLPASGVSQPPVESGSGRRGLDD
jgi:ATP-dependent phosphofructokinase / diphosphate-dependent phosphofructokinase